LPLPDIIQRCCFVERDILAGSGDTSEEIAGFMSGYVVLPDVFRVGKETCREGRQVRCRNQVAY
jgi:hypothetical protein